MNPRTLISLLIFITMLSDQIPQTQAMNPYTVLGLKRTSTDNQVHQKYKRLRSRNRNSRFRKNMVKQAYDQIMVERKFNSPQQNKNTIFEQVKLAAPTQIDQTYVYGYKLGDEYDDGSYFSKHYNQTKIMVQKMQSSQGNKKTAQMIMFIGSLFLKIAPCVIIFFICRNRRGNQVPDVLGRAAAGYRRLGRAMRPPR